LPLLHQTRCLY